jgi:probable F420-dependent oxidoreductase
LGTQVRAHIERRFGMEWPDSPVGKLREMLAAIRAFWRSWGEGERLNLRGEYYTLTLMTPFFNPGPIESPAVPIYLAGVNTGLCQLAGARAEGFHVHPYHSSKYLREVVVPALREGAKREGRSLDDVRVSVTAMALTEPAERDFLRSQIGFYASTPSYRPVMATHGWGDLADRLRSLASRGEWGEMTALISDEVLETFAVVAPPDRLAEALKERYLGVADHLTLYTPFQPGQRDDFWKALAREIKGG